MEVNAKKLRGLHKGLVEDISILTSFLSPGDRIRMVQQLDAIEEELKNGSNGMGEFENAKERLKSALLLAPAKMKTDAQRNFLYNRFSDFLLVLKWHIYKEEGYKVGNEPWRLKEEEPEKEEKKVPSVGGITLSGPLPLGLNP